MLQPKKLIQSRQLTLQHKKGLDYQPRNALRHQCKTLSINPSWFSTSCTRYSLEKAHAKQVMYLTAWNRPGLKTRNVITLLFKSFNIHPSQSFHISIRCLLCCLLTGWLTNQSARFGLIELLQNKILGAKRKVGRAGLCARSLNTDRWKCSEVRLGRRATGKERRARDAKYWSASRQLLEQA